ncbi:MAG: gliding motility-associated C-terminal domain-containing protein [Burkholderiales bacterium]|nr:gliding motility-associated C-terminal domain-containing protein [Bacteroidia bacterium]
MVSLIHNKILYFFIVLVFLVSSFSLKAQCNLLCNTDFDNNQVTLTVGIVDASLVPCWGTTASDNKIEVWASGFNGVPSYSGNQFIELNAFMVSTLYQDFMATPGTLITASFAHRGRAGTDVMSVEIGPVGGPYTLLGTYSDGNTAWGYYTVNYTVPMGLGNNYSLRFNSISAAGGNPAIGNFLDAITVALPSSVSLSLTATPVSCAGVNDGTTLVSVTGGASPFSYTWAPSGGNASTATALSAGIYSVNVTESNGCSKTGTVAVTQGTTFSLTVSSQSTSCFGSSDGSAQVTVNGGSAPYSYTWMPTGLNTASITSVSSGIYTVNVSNSSGGCIITNTLSVGQGTALLLTTSSQSVSCFGAMDGTAQVTVNGGSAANSYTWIPGGLNTATITSLSAGNYTVNVSNSGGCAGTKTVTVNQGAPLNISVSSQSVSCLGAADGSLQANTTGGIGSYTYTWLPGGANTTLLSGLSAGNYTVQTTSSNGCSGSQTVSVTQGLPINLTITSKDISCFGLSDGSAQVTVNGGAGPYTYSWMPVSSSSTSVTGLSAGVYTVQSSSSNGCFGSNTFFITQPSALHVTVFSQSISCSGSPNGSAQVMATGGTSPYSYSWTPGAMNLSAITGLSSGNYSCYINDVNLCTTSVSFTIVNVPSPTISVNSATICVSKPATLYAFGALSYTWLPGNKNGSAFQTNPLTTTSYSIVGINQYGCKDTVMTSVFVNPLPTANAGNDTVVNIDELITLSGNGSDFYGWIPYGNNDPLSCNYCHVLSENPQKNTCYVLEATNSFNCYNSDTVCISITKDWSIYIPNAFTPNNNGINDLFIPVGYGIIEIELLIFDRWGELIFKSDETKKGWDGTYKNILCKPGVYIYKANITTMAHHEEQRTGHVTLLK